MTLRFYNTLSRSLEEFEPLEPGKVLVYGCGPTIYDFPHIGNFRTFIAFDLLHRFLEWSGFEVRLVTNLTDVDDKTIRGALKEGITIGEYTAPFGEAFLEDARALGIRPSDLYPKATDYVEAMVEFVRRLEAKGLAYQAEDGSVYFSISSFPEYGRLSRIDPDAVKPGARVSMDEYAKEDVRDFALWKAAKPEEEQAGAAWDSPWGRGRPGWHLECSVMSIAELGETLDIHLGGEDLIFPHHEDEIAQSEGVTGKPFVRYWLHVKHLRLEGQKMSKSLGNTVSVGDLLGRGYDPAAIRHQLLSAQYRRELNFTMEGLDGSSKAVQRLLDFEARLNVCPVADDAPETRIPESARAGLDRFREAMNDDLNSAEALGAVFVFLNEVNAELDRVGGPIRAEDRAAGVETLRSMDEVLGLLELAREARAVDDTTEEWIQEQIRLRNEARGTRDFAAADVIRDALAARGIVLEDSAEGTRWKVVK
ncbi:MAG: cysteine--tRNA ligase [Longimicrobiales bacterium]|nr:cysteine--tRNA ligase [Longimicrobiales bacterium]